GYKVTGVQTCALPISAALPVGLVEVNARPPSSTTVQRVGDGQDTPNSSSNVPVPTLVAFQTASVPGAVELRMFSAFESSVATHRSEERRVGKGRGEPL